MENDIEVTNYSPEETVSREDEQAETEASKAEHADETSSESKTAETPAKTVEAEVVPEEPAAPAPAPAKAEETTPVAATPAPAAPAPAAEPAVEKSASKAEAAPATAPAAAPKLVHQEALPRPEAFKFLHQQSVEVGPPAVPGQTRARRHPNYPEFLEYVDPKTRTLDSMFEVAVEKFKGKELFGVPHRPAPAAPPPKPDGKKHPEPPKVKTQYKFITFDEAQRRAKNFGSGLINLGVAPYRNVGMYSKNRVEWMLSEFAAAYHAMPVVAIYDTFGEDTIEYVINHAELPVLICSKESIGKIVNVADRCPTVKHIIQIETVTEEQRKTYSAKTKTPVLSFEEVEKSGADKPAPAHPPKPSDLAVIMYTSGTTGMPKGVEITHANIMATIAGAIVKLVDVRPDDTYLSYLPLAHIFERVAIHAMISGGAKIGFGDPRTIIEDLQGMQPSLLCGVPRVFDRIYTSLMNGVDSAGFLKKKLFTWGLEKKKKNMQDSHHLFRESEGKTSFYNSIVFSKLKERVGLPRLRKVVSGGAPLSPQVHEFLRAVFGCPVMQGYGLTETCAGSSASDPNDPTLGHIGGPFPNCEFKLVDIPEMNYSASAATPEGEIWIRGPSVARGYYKNPEQTRADFDADGWFHTGDVGRLNPNGTFSIIDRKKNIFKLSQGEYVAAEKLEGAFAESRFVSQIFVWGDSFTPCLIAIIVPEPVYTRKWAEENHVKGETLDELYENAAVKKAIQTDIDRIHKEKKMNGIEAIKNIWLTSEEWTPELGIVTPSLKLKRAQARDYFKSEIYWSYKDMTPSIELDKFKPADGQRPKRKAASAAAPAPASSADGKAEAKP